MADISEPDWKVFKSLHKELLENYSQGILDKLKSIDTERNISAHQCYLAIYDTIKKKDKSLGRLFGDFRRSTAIICLINWHRSGLLTEQMIQKLSGDTQEKLRVSEEL